MFFLAYGLIASPIFLLEQSVTLGLQEADPAVTGFS